MAGAQKRRDLVDFRARQFGSHRRQHPLKIAQVGLELPALVSDHRGQLVKVVQALTDRLADATGRFLFERRARGGVIAADRSRHARQDGMEQDVDVAPRGTRGCWRKGCHALRCGEQPIRGLAAAIR